MPALHDAATAALKAVRGVAGKAVTIVRGDSEAEATATIGKTVFVDKADAAAARAVHWTETRDFIVLATDYLVDGEPATPAVGDQVREDGRTYEAVSVYGEPCYRFADPAQTWLRVHTTLVDF